MCIPAHVQMVSITKPKDAEMRLKWKLECMNVSKECGKNAKKVFSESKCQGNFVKSKLHEKQVIDKMRMYLNGSKTLNNAEDIGKTLKENEAHKGIEMV